jgi:hypothetical protein
VSVEMADLRPVVIPLGKRMGIGDLADQRGTFDRLQQRGHRQRHSRRQRHYGSSDRGCVCWRGAQDAAEHSTHDGDGADELPV